MSDLESDKLRSTGHKPETVQMTLCIIGIPIKSTDGAIWQLCPISISMDSERARSQPLGCETKHTDPVKVEIISAEGDRRIINGVWQQLLGELLFLDTSELVPSRTAVTIEREGVLFIGEVTVCERLPDPFWRLRIAVKHKLTSLQSLMRLRSALLYSEPALPMRLEVGITESRR